MTDDQATLEARQARLAAHQEITAFKRTFPRYAAPGLNDGVLPHFEDPSAWPPWIEETKRNLAAQAAKRASEYDALPQMAEAEFAAVLAAGKWSDMHLRSTRGFPGLCDIGLNSDGSLSNPFGYPIGAVRACLARAILAARERRRASARAAAKTAARRRQFKVWEAAHRVREKQGIGNLQSCFVCGRALTDPPSITRGIGPECWEEVVQHPIDRMKTRSFIEALCEFADADPASPEVWLERLAWIAAPGNLPPDGQAFEDSLSRVAGELWSRGVGVSWRRRLGAGQTIAIHTVKKKARKP
jgi:hypothetical protein